MSSDSTGGVYEAISQQFDTKSYQFDLTEPKAFPATFGMAENGEINRIFTCSKMCTPISNNTDYYDFYLIQDDTNLALPLIPTLYLDWFEFSYSLQTDEGITIGNDGAMLQQESPQGTDEGETITSSCTQTLSASAGFFGDQVTGSVGTSVSMGKSVSRFVPGVSVKDTSLQGSNGNDVKITYIIAETSASQQGTTELCNQMLFRVKRSLAPNGVQVLAQIRIGTRDHDGDHGTHYFDDFAIAFSRVFGRPLSYQGDRGGYFNVDYTTSIIGVPATL